MIGTLVTGSLFTAPLGGVIFLSLWTLGMTSIAGFFAYRVLFRPTLYSRIDEAGIIADGRKWAWNEIACVFVESASPGVILCFRQKGLAGGFRQPVHGMPSLSEEEAARVLERLSEFLAVSWPHVSVA